MTTDPFDALRQPVEPVPPDPAFVARLRRQVVAALTSDLPAIELPDPSPTVRSETMTTTDTTAADPGSTTATGLVPYLCIAGAAAALDWYRDVFGAELLVRYDGDDGRLGHAELSLAGAHLHLSDEYPEMGIVGPRSLGGTSVSLTLEVPDVDATYAKAVANGAAVEREPTEQFYGYRSTTMIDPFGHRWHVQTKTRDLTFDEIDAASPGFTVTPGPGAASSLATDPAARPPIELGYFTMAFPDTGRAERFFGALFGWTTEGGSMGDGYAHVANTRLPLGFTPGAADDPSVLYFRVAELAPYVARVRELGGEVVTEGAYESGPGAECRDDQGRVFHLWEPAPGH